PTIPNLDLDSVGADEILDITRRFLQTEKDDLAELERLARKMSDKRDTTLWGVLVDIMLRDTKQHISILEFVDRHAKRTGSPIQRHFSLRRFTRGRFGRGALSNAVR